jgi:hypothetical protein
MHKRQKGANVKTHYEFGSDSMKMCFEHKTRMKVDYRIKNINFFIFIISIVILLWSIFHSEFFYVWACTFFFSFIVICIHLKCYTTSDVQFIMWKEKLVNQKRKDVLFDVFLMYFLFWLIFFLIIWSSFVHHIITI